MRESIIETYFKRRVKETGGTVRKLAWVNHVGAPDRAVGWPATIFRDARHVLVELKATNGILRSSQVREHARLHAIGFKTYVLSSIDAVERFIQEMTC